MHYLKKRACPNIIFTHFLNYLFYSSLSSLQFSLFTLFSVNLKASKAKEIRMLWLCSPNLELQTQLLYHY
jgi:hypothetical protein